MSDNIKFVIEIPKTPKNDHERWVLAHGIPLDSVKAKILDYNVRKHVSGSESFLKGYAVGMDKSAEILDNISKAESENI